MSRFARQCFGVVRGRAQVATICSLSMLVIGSGMTGLFLLERRAEACNRTPPPPDMCEKSINSRKRVQRPIAYPGGIALAIFVTTEITTDSGPTSGNTCMTPSSVSGGTVELTMRGPGPGGPIVPGFPQNGPIPPIPAGMQNTTVTTLINVPAGLAAGLYFFTGTATVTWTVDSAGNGGSSFSSGDTVVCLVEESFPDSGLPRLDMAVVNVIGEPECGAGAQREVVVTLFNNDPVESVTVTMEATASQNARMPGGDAAGTFSISSPVSGDELVICPKADLPASGILPMPAVPVNYVQQPISTGAIVVPAGGQVDVAWATNSHGMCGSGSCAEYTFTATGSFSGGDPVTACMGATTVLVEAADCEDAIFEEACCFGNGTCQNLLPMDCTDASGEPLGAYTECKGDVDPANGVDDACDSPGLAGAVRACCFEDSTCQDMNAFACTDDGGTPQLAGVLCASNPCPALGACNFAGGCNTLLETACNSSGGNYAGDGTVCPAQGCCWRCDGATTICASPVFEDDCTDNWVLNETCGTSACGLGKCPKIPTVSVWGLIVLTLLTIAIGTVILRRLGERGVPELG